MSTLKEKEKITLLMNCTAELFIRFLVVLCCVTSNEHSVPLQVPSFQRYPLHHHSFVNSLDSYWLWIFSSAHSQQSLVIRE